MQHRDIIVIGTSAGGLEALKILVKSLQPDIDASIFIVLHIPEHTDSKLPHILQKHTDLPVKFARDGDDIEKGHIYIAAARGHLMVEEDKIVIGKGPRENKFKPAIDALFRSAAFIYRKRVIGVLLGGVLDDGTSGLWNIKRLGGIAVVQDEKEPAFPQMIFNAKEYVDIDYEVPIGEMGDLLLKLTGNTSDGTIELSEKEAKLLEIEIIISKKDKAYDLGILNYGEFTPITCPDCHGALTQISEGRIIRYRCHTGHAFSPSTLLAGISRDINNSLFKAMKGMEEVSLFLNKLAHKFRELDRDDLSTNYLKKVQEIEDKAQQIHKMSLEHEQISGDPERYKED